MIPNNCSMVESTSCQTREVIIRQAEARDIPGAAKCGAELLRMHNELNPRRFFSVRITAGLSHNLSGGSLNSL